MRDKMAVFGSKVRLDEYINMARSGERVQLHVRLHRQLFKQLGQSDSSDDIQTETDVSLLMADYVPDAESAEGVVKISKVYMICPINDSEINDKTTLRITNARLRMDYARLKKAGVVFEEKYF